MRKFLATICLIILVTVSSSCNARMRNVSAGDIISAPLRTKPPVCYFLNEDNDEISIKELRGKPTILHFWASWCGDCIKEMTELNQFVFDVEENELADINIIAPSIDHGGKAVVKNYMKKNNIKHIPIITDSKSEAFAKFKLRSIPATIILDKKGKIALIAKEPISWSSPEIQEVIQILNMEQ